MILKMMLYWHSLEIILLKKENEYENKNWDVKI